MDDSNDFGYSSSSDEGRMQIDESAGRSDDEGPKNIVQPPSVFETLKENDDDDEEVVVEEGSDEEEEDDEDEDDDDEEEEGDEDEEGEEEEETEDDDDDEEEEEEWEEYEEDDVDAGLGVSAAVESDDGDEDPCPICLNKFRDQDQGTPESCDHHFCLECIQEWAKNVNTCPVDRQVFRLILAKHAGDDAVYRRITVEDKNKQEEAEDELTYCEVCGRCDREDRLLLCDGCDLGYHLECLTPPLSVVPVDEWFCSDCAAANKGTSAVTSEEEEEVVRPRRRLIARTLVSERVRTLIHQTRLERARQRRILSSSEDENATAPKRATPKKPPVKRKVIKRRKTRRRRRVRKTKTGAKKGTKTKGRKRKTRRRKTRKGLKRRKIKRLTARTPVVKTVKTRIAEKLGLSKPPVGLSIPLQKLPTGKSMDMQRAEIGISSFSILGHKDDLEPVYEDENESEEQPGTSSSCPVTSRIVKYSKSSLLSRKPVFKISTTAERVSNPSTTNAAPSATTSAASVDILGSIMQGQSFLHMQSKDVTIHKDGSLKPNKEVPEAKISEVKDNRIFELNTFRKDSETKESKEEESYSNPLQPDQTSPDNTADTSHEKSDSDYLTVFGIGEENSKEKGKEDVSSKDKENENIYDPSEPTEDVDIFPEESVPVNKSAESKKNSDTSSKLPVHSDISDDDSSSEKRVVVEKDSSLMIELSRTDDNTPDSQNSQSRRQSFQEGGKKTDVPAGKEAEDEKASFEDGEILRTEEDTRESPGRWSVDSDESALEKEYQMRMQEFAKLSKKEKKVHRRMEADQVEEGEESVFDRLNFGEYDARAYRSREKKESRRRRKREQEEKKEKLLLSRHDSKRENLKVHEEVKSDRESLKVYDDVRCEKDEIYVYEECEVPAEKREKSKHDKHSKSEQYAYESDTHVKRKHRRDKSRSQSRSREKVRTRSHSKDRYRTRSRSREKHKSRSVSRGRHKSRSRSKEKHGTHSKERQSTRSHDRSRRKRRERDRSGSKERSPERERSSKKKKRDKDRERERDRSREKTDRKNWHSRTPSDSPSPVKHSDKDSLSKENRHHHKRKSSRLDDYDDFPVAEKTKKTKSIETAKPHFEKTMKVIEHTCNCNDPIVIDDDDDEDGVEDSVIFGSIGVNFEDIPTPSMPPPPKKGTACATKDKVSSPANKDSSKSAESDGKIPTIIDQKVQANEDPAGKKDGKEKKIPTIIDKVASDTNEKKLEADIEGEMHNYDPAHPTDEELEKEILEFSHSNHQASDTLSSVPPLPQVNSPIVNNRMGFPSVEPANIPLPPASSLPHISTLPQVSTFPPSSLPSVSPLPPVSFNMIPTVPTSIVQAPVLVNPLLLNGPVQFQPLPRIPAAGPAPQFGWPVNSTQVMPVQNQFGPPIVTRPPIMSTIPQALLNGGISEIPADTDSRFPQNIPVNNPTSSMPMTLNPTNQISVGAAQGLSPHPTDTLLSASKILASANNKETEKPALPIQQLQNISTLLKVQACLAGKNSKHDGVFKVPQPVSSSKHKSRENEDPLDSMEMIDMELSPLDEECELVLPTPPDPVNKNRKSRKSKHSHSKSVKALASQQDDMPSSAAELTNKEKYLKKLHLQERVVDEVKCAIKPYYSSKKITKEEYKEILRKAVPKVCHSKAGEINPMKIKSLVDAYVNKFHKRRHGSSKKSKKDESKANGMKTKASR